MLLPKSLLATAACAVFALTACKSTSGFGGSTEADPRLTNDDFSYNSSSYAVSCGTGALLAGGICLLIADKNNRAACIAAAAVGCAAGMGTNALLDNLRKSYHTKEQQLDGLISYISENNTKAQQMLAAAKSVYEEDNAKLKQLTSDIKQGQDKHKETEALIARYQANIKVLEENLAEHNKQLASFEGVRKELAAGSSARERQQLKECDQRIAELKENLDNLHTQYLSYTDDLNTLNLAYSG